MDAIINLNREPGLREAFDHAHVVGNTVLVDRRTKWGNPWRTGRSGTREEVIARYRADLWRSLRAPLASMADRSGNRFAGRAARRRPWGPCRGRELANRCAVPLCHTCSLRQPCGSSAPLRRGEAPPGIAPGRPWLGPKLRQGSFLARLR